MLGGYAIKKHIGSTIALGFGVLSIISGLANTAKESGGVVLHFGGIIIILGALAYRSAKKRKLGEVKSSSLRKASEGCAMVCIITPLLQKDFPDNVINSPITILIIPLWAIIAYIVISLKKQKAEKKGKEFLTPSINSKTV